MAYKSAPKMFSKYFAQNKLMIAKWIGNEYDELDTIRIIHICLKAKLEKLEKCSQDARK